MRMLEHARRRDEQYQQFVKKCRMTSGFDYVNHMGQLNRPKRIVCRDTDPARGLAIADGVGLFEQP